MPSFFFPFLQQFMITLFCNALHHRQQKRRLSRGMAKAYGNTSMASVIESAAYSRRNSFAMMQDSEGQHVHTLGSTYTQTRNFVPLNLDFLFFTHHCSTATLTSFHATCFIFLLFCICSTIRPHLSAPLIASHISHYLILPSLFRRVDL